MTEQTWFITGASRGLGRALLDAVAARGDQAVAAVRRPEALAAYQSNQRVLVTRLDVTDPASILEARDSALERFDHIDVLVNNAGRGLLGPVEETSDSEARALFDINFFGVLDTTRAILPTLRRQRSGIVVNISSVGGFTALPGSGVYAATKFAVEAVSESLAAELDGTGVRIMVIEPGAFRTDFLDSSSIVTTEADPIDDYVATVHQGQPAFLAASGRQIGDPWRGAEVIIDAVKAAEPPFRLQLGADSVERVERKLAFVKHELDTWRPVSVSTGFDSEVSSVDVEDL
ncbi:SDR family NAD(P)-dependent oxidoreductase [uncultured Leifsonia sp.]|uniref:SDR family NAD(P)-dependent oxidoreductase n=1 Tax=uncultured Leifsonia sp. TaxID=340359 RepID=UPI0028D5F9C7|nr:SDR family NAD(P)-dependent oxidoreductase [uncultured Leifsonia sp.]